MGYQVYDDSKAKQNWGVERWAGYGVPAVCDYEDCQAQIDRGLDYCCEDHVYYIEREDDDVEIDGEGCYKFFCYYHLHKVSEHDIIVPKPDSGEWLAHMLTDDSWSEWRELNPERTKEMKRLLLWGEARSV